MRASLIFKKKVSIFLSLMFCAQSSFSEEILQDILIKEGDTLWKIAQIYLKDPTRWPEILKHNPMPINSLFVPLPGKHLKVPIQLIKDHLRYARVVSIKDQSQYRKSQSDLWNDVHENLKLLDRDYVNTNETGEVFIEMQQQGNMKLYPNTSVMFLPNRKVSGVQLWVGRLALRIKSNIELITPSAIVHAYMKDTIYKAKVLEDKTTTIQVEKGEAKVSGKKNNSFVLVPAGYSNEVRFNESPTEPIQTPDLVEIDRLAFLGGGIPVRSKSDQKNERILSEVHYRNWKAFRIQIAKDLQFKQVERDVQMDVKPGVLVTDQRDYQLSDGNYYQRVAYLDREGTQTQFYELPLLKIDNKNPFLEIFYPENGLETREKLLQLEGHTEVGTIVTVNGYPVEVFSDGRFRWSVLLVKDGKNVIQIIAKDLEDHKTILERTITFRK